MICVARVITILEAIITGPATMVIINKPRHPKRKWLNNNGTLVDAYEKENNDEMKEDLIYENEGEEDDEGVAAAENVMKKKTLIAEGRK